MPITSSGSPRSTGAPKRARPSQKKRSLGARLRRPGVAGIVLPVALIALVLLAWAVDAGRNSGNVGRNVDIAGVDVGRLDDASLAQQLNEIAAGYANTKVIIRTADGEVTTTAGVVGLELDPVATAETVMSMGRGNAVGRPFSWARSLFSDRTAEASVRLGIGDDALLASIVNAAQPEPVEPSLTLSNSEVTVIAGRSVEVFDLSHIREDVVEAARSGASPIIVEAASLDLNPAMTDEQAQSFADDFNTTTADGFTVVAMATTEAFDAATVRDWMMLEAGPEGFTFTLDQQQVDLALTQRFAENVGPAQDPVVTVIDGEPRLEAYVAIGCCAADANEHILRALMDGRSRTGLALKQLDTSEQDLLAEYGVIELIGESTTPHDCCRSRVTNIQLFADLMTGVIIKPGDTLSLNDFVGRRTAENGFVESGVIYFGRLQTDVGGGISQFATTIFQAMFYAGLDIDKYQAHTLWFSRYADREGRRGVESTISFPEPDVQFTNNTPYPVLIWPTYTETSLTVSIYSTKWAEADVADQAIFGSGQCTVIDTNRIRTYPDGTEEIDSFRARYQPSDGVGCDGKPTDPNAPTPTPEPEEDDGDADAGGDGDGDAGGDAGSDDSADAGADAGADDSGADAGADAGATDGSGLDGG